MNPNPPLNNPEVPGESATRPGADKNQAGVEGAPPPPSPEALARHQARSKAEFAASAAMIKDILDAGPGDDPEDADEEAPPMATDATPEARTPPEDPMAADIFSSTRPKRRFRHRKK